MIKHLIVVGTVIALSFSAFAMTVKQLSNTELVTNSKLVAALTVTNIEYPNKTTNKQRFTIVTCKLNDIIRDETGSKLKKNDTIQLRFFGTEKTYGFITQNYKFSKDQKMILFLGKNKLGYYYPIGVRQGIFKWESDNTKTRKQLIKSANLTSLRKSNELTLTEAKALVNQKM